MTFCSYFSNTKLSWVFNMTQQNLCGWCFWSTRFAGGFKLINKFVQTLLKHVVAQVHNKIVVAQEVVRDKHTVRQAQWRILRYVGDLYAEL